MRKKITALGLATILTLCFLLGACAHDDVRDLSKDRDGDVIYCFDDTVIDDREYNQQDVVAALSDFSIELLIRNMEETEENVLISPTSIITALGMTSFGAKGETLSQMEEVFGVKRGLLTHHNAKYLRSTTQELKLANSIWFTDDERLTVKEQFLQFNEEFYGADLYETAFDNRALKAINGWVEEKTDGMIKDILDTIPEGAVMYLINALVFEAEWETKYDSGQIGYDMDFYPAKGETQKVDMMFSTEGTYLQDEHATGFVKYYKDRNYAFVALLPEEGMHVIDYLEQLSGEKLQNILTNAVTTSVEVTLPQFSYEYDVELSKILMEMGMVDAFDGGKADFSCMATSSNGNIFISRVIHKTFIEVSPVGTKAGAATVVEAMDECEPYFEKEVRLERPFVYMIMDCESNQPIFIGVVNSVE